MSIRAQRSEKIYIAFFGEIIPESRANKLQARNAMAPAKSPHLFGVNLNLSRACFHNERISFIRLDLKKTRISLANRIDDPCAIAVHSALRLWKKSSLTLNRTSRVL